MQRDPELVEAITALWQVPPPGPDNLFAAPEFLHLSALCGERFGDGRMNSALWNALRSLGLPCRLPIGLRHLVRDPADVADRLIAAFAARSTRIRYLCPLDLADDLPNLIFGNARITQPDRETIDQLFDAPRLRRLYPAKPLDSERLAKFRWLVVEEEVEIDPRPEARAIPIFYTDLRKDLGAIDPHLGRFPQAVERALFFLVLGAWEDWQRMHEVDWRGFCVPWIYELDCDLAIQPKAPPSPDTLSLEWRTYYDGWGDEVELEVPTYLDLDAPVQSLAGFDDAAWHEFEAALATPLFEPPVQHFLVHAFLTEGIDEVMAHMTAIEAALGEESDYRPKQRLQPDPAPNLKATKRMAARVAGVLDDAQAGRDYLALFELRSAFVHGRGGLGSIPTPTRVLARRLARRVAGALVTRAMFPIQSRAHVLRDFLIRGIPLL